jgi:hypothetical protein
MTDDTAATSFWSGLHSSDTLTGIAMLGLIVVIIVFTAQLEALFSACRTLLAYRQQLQTARRRLEQDIAAAVTAAEAINQSLPDLQAAVVALGDEYEKLAAEASEARKLHIREVVMSDIFVQQGDRPFLATVYRPEPDPDEPLARDWQAGRDHVLYGADLKAATRRFAQRYPTDRGFVVGEVTPFSIPWAPVEAAEAEGGR